MFVFCSATLQKYNILLTADWTIITSQHSLVLELEVCPFWPPSAKSAPTPQQPPTWFVPRVCFCFLGFFFFFPFRFYKLDHTVFCLCSTLFHLAKCLKVHAFCGQQQDFLPFLWLDSMPPYLDTMFSFNDSSVQGHLGWHPCGGRCK